MQKAESPRSFVWPTFYSRESDDSLEEWAGNGESQFELSYIVPKSSMLHSKNDLEASLDNIDGGDEDLKLLEESSKKEFDISNYMSRREMNKSQERVNALTILPGAVYCMYYILAGRWLPPSAVEDARSGSSTETWSEDGCIQSTWFPHLHSIPPITIAFIAFGVCAHAPFSFMYHWKYAHQLPAGAPRIEHWSRRMDHAFIHVASAFISYGVSGRWDYFLANFLFNADCAMRQFRTKVRPLSNHVRIGIAILSYSIPLLHHGEWIAFAELSVIFALAGWLFGAYPIGGWSHSAFHIVIALTPLILMNAALRLPINQDFIEKAAQCAVLHEQLL